MLHREPLAQLCLECAVMVRRRAEIEPLEREQRVSFRMANGQHGRHAQCVGLGQRLQSGCLGFERGQAVRRRELDEGVTGLTRPAHATMHAATGDFRGRCRRK